MTAFWISACVMLAVALAFVVPGLLRGGTPDVSEAAVDARRRLKSLEQAFRDGHLSEEDYTERKQAIAGSLLDAVEPQQQTPRSVAAGVLLLIAAPIFAVMMYLQIGNPRAIELGRPVAGSSGAGGDGSGQPGAPELASAVTQLAARLAQNPEDVDGWFLMGRSYRAMDRYAEAADAFRRALELVPDQPVILIELAEALAFQSGEPTLPQEARDALDKAMAQDPTLQKGLWLQGLDAFNLGNYERALERWQALAAQLEPGSDGARQIAEQIAQVEQALGREPSIPASVAATPGPGSEAGGADQSDGAAQLTVEISLAPELASRVTPDDVLFVFARAHNGPPMPLAIQRLTAAELPTSVRLDSTMAMMPAMNLAAFPEVVVGARISKTGNATAQPGDMEALSEPIANNQAQPVRLEIATVL